MDLHQRGCQLCKFCLSMLLASSVHCLHALRSFRLLGRASSAGGRRQFQSVALFGDAAHVSDRLSSARHCVGCLPALRKTREHTTPECHDLIAESFVTRFAFRAHASETLICIAKVHQERPKSRVLVPTEIALDPLTRLINALVQLTQCSNLCEAISAKVVLEKDVTNARGHIFVAFAVPHVARRIEPRDTHSLSASEPADGRESLLTQLCAHHLGCFDDTAKVGARATDFFDAGAVADGFLDVSFQGLLRARVVWLSVEVNDAAVEEHFGTVG